MLHLPIHAARRPRGSHNRRISLDRRTRLSAVHTRYVPSLPATPLVSPGEAKLSRSKPDNRQRASPQISRLSPRLRRCQRNRTRPVPLARRAPLSLHIHRDALAHKRRASVSRADRALPVHYPPHARHCGLRDASHLGRRQHSDLVH
jgi:hypothetical protein